MFVKNQFSRWVGVIVLGLNAIAQQLMIPAYLFWSLSIFTLDILGISGALRAQARRASVEVSVEGTAPRSADEPEAGVYFCCPEAMQNVAKHAGRAAHVTLQLHHEHGTVAVRIEDDRDGFDPAHTPDGAGLRNIDDRIQTLGGTLKLTSSPGPARS